MNRELIQRALDALESASECQGKDFPCRKVNDALAELRAFLAAPVAPAEHDEFALFRNDLCDFLRHVIDMGKGDHYWDVVCGNAGALLRRVDRVAPVAPIPYFNRRAVERALEAMKAPQPGMQLNDTKERPSLPAGTLERMLKIIDFQALMAARMSAGDKPATSEPVAWLSPHGMPHDQYVPGDVPLYAAPPDVQRDAERYRWLLTNYARGDGYTDIDGALNDGRADAQLSPAIDAAMAAKVPT